MGEQVYAGIVTFNPECNRLKDNIEAVYPQVKKVIIFDNGSDNVEQITEIIGKYKEIDFIRSENNKGIAFALNRIFEYAENDCSWILTLDQDSISPGNLVEQLMTIISENVAIACPRICDMNVLQNNSIANGTSSINRCITSGSLTSVKVWRSIGGFDEKMFIDGVDFDFCDRARKKGYRILRNNNVELSHEIGHITIHKLLWFPVAVNNHSAFRKYYIAKNIVYLDRKNKDKYYPVKTILRVCKQIFLVALFESEKTSKIHNIFRGAKDGFKECINR